MDASRTIRPSELVDGAHLWLAEPDAIPADRWYEWLSPTEHARANDMSHPGARDTFVRARGFLRWVLSHYGDLSPHQWQFVLNDHGRPELSVPQRALWQLHFNISHTDGLIACIATHGTDVGVDVENLGRRNQTDKIAHRYFSRAEVEHLTNVEDPVTRKERFFEIWTLKEAYIKARGLGLAIPLARFSFELSPPRLTFHTDPELEDPASDWQFGLLRPPGERHRAALAIDLRPVTAPDRLPVQQLRCLRLVTEGHVEDVNIDWIATTPAQSG